MNKGIVYILILIVIINLNCFAQIQSSPLTLFDTWNITVIGVQTDDYENFSDKQKLVSVTLRPILSSIIQEVDAHFLSTEERQTARELQYDDAMSILSKKMEKLNKDLDAETLKNEKAEIFELRSKKAKEKRILRRRIRKLQRLNVNSIQVKEQLPIIYKQQNEYLHFSTIEDFNAIAVKLEAHSLFYYKLYALNDFIIIEMYEFNILTKRSRKILQTIINPERITEIYTSLKLSLQTILLGGPVAGLKIAVHTKGEESLFDAKILLDGVVVGFGEINIHTLLAGTHIITIIYRDKQKEEVVVLKNNERLERVYFFDIDLDDVMLIRSNPSGAKVYINSVWAGNTPVVIQRPLFVEQLEITSPEYQTHRKSISIDSASVYDAILIPINPIPLSDRLATDRKQFYNAFSMFAISLAVPIIMNGLYINEANAISIGGASLSPAGASESATRRNAFLYSYIGSSLVSTGFGVFTYIRLRKYLNTASEYQDR